MAKHSYERASWNRREARQRVRVGKWPYFSHNYTSEFRDHPERFLAGYGIDFTVPAWVLYRSLPHEVQYKLSVQANQIWLNRSVHGCLGEATRRYRKMWRRRAHEQERLHLQELHDVAEELDPQPRRLGVMWDIW